MAKLISAMSLAVAILALPLSSSAEPVPFTETPMYKYLCEAGQEKSPTYKKQLAELEKQKPQSQLQKQPEQKTDTVPAEKAYKPTFETIRRPIRERDYKPMSALTTDTAFAEAIDMLRHSVRPPLNIVVFWKDASDSLHTWSLLTFGLHLWKARASPPSQFTRAGSARIWHKVL